MARSSVMMPQKNSSGSQIIPLAGAVIGGIYGGPSGASAGYGLGNSAVGFYDKSSGGPQGAVQAGGGVAAPQQKDKMGMFGDALGAIGSGMGISKAGGATPTASQDLMDKPQTGSPYELPAQDFPEQGPAMDRRMGALDGGNPNDQLLKAKDALSTQPKEVQDAYGPVIDGALYAARIKGRPEGSTAPLSSYGQTKRYGGY